MLPEKIEKRLLPIVTHFVKSREGFYRKHCSDEMLIALIMNQMRLPGTSNVVFSVGEEIVNGDVNAAYNSVVWLFESVLEHGCKAGGNGHHVAQKFCSHVELAFG